MSNLKKQSNNRETDRQVVNPFLPSYEYIPDGEPHVFGDRVYLYGNHDKFNGKFFCMNDYVCYSASVTDLSEWRYEGVIWKKSDDPNKYRGLLKQMYAPDVVNGNDGRYYLYYFMGNDGTIGVAVCDTPVGEYKYYGRVKYPDGTILGRNNEKDLHQFDPGVFKDDDGRIYLYSGFAPKNPNIFTGFKPVNSNGAMGVELEQDMLTIKLPTARIAKSIHCSRGTSFEGHEFFEAPSMRKFNGKYYFIYSSVNGHELCYAIGDSPLGEFEYKGVLVSIGDVGLYDKPTNYLGNTHGSVEYFNGSYYVFYHRQTNRHCHSRQACAEKLAMLEDGRFEQAEITTQGLNAKPLVGLGTYEARTACNLTSKKGVRFYTAKFPAGCHPYFTQSGADREELGDQYIANFCNGAIAGFKYYDMCGAKSIRICLEGRGKGVIIVSDGENELGQVYVCSSYDRKIYTGKLKRVFGVKPLYFRFKGCGRFNFYWFCLEE